MKRFEILDHPADIGIEIKGKSLEDLFINAALGTTSLMIEQHEISANTKKEINLKGNDMENLFIKWLDEVIYLFDTEGFLIKNVLVETLRATSLRAILHGEKYNKIKHEIKLYLKSVTYHQLEIKQTKKGWGAKVFFDV